MQRKKPIHCNEKNKAVKFLNKNILFANHSKGLGYYGILIGFNKKNGKFIVCRKGTNKKISNYLYCRIKMRINMVTKNDKIVCDWCGKFISYQDLQEGKAYNIMIYPDSEITKETYVSKCKECFNPDAKLIMPTDLYVKE